MRGHVAVSKHFCEHYNTCSIFFLQSELQSAPPSVAGQSVDQQPANYVPEIRKYQRKFNYEILCGNLWGVNLLIGKLKIIGHRNVNVMVLVSAVEIVWRIL